MKHSILFILLFTLLSCGGEKPPYSPSEVAAQSAAYGEMMEIHDRVMPRMGEIAQAQQGLMTAMETAELPEERKEVLTQTNEQLEAAYDGMMDWMGELSSLEELRNGTAHAEILTYIDNENKKMLAIEQSLNEGIKQATQLLTEQVE